MTRRCFSIHLLSISSCLSLSRSILVKFTGDVSNPVQARWADLLRAEDLANEVLRDAGIPAAETEIREAEGRVFLISERFDRSPSGGRLALVSLHALNAAFGDVNRSWAASAEDLHEQGWLDVAGALRLALIQCFGRLIGNTDMHDGNCSLFLSRTRPLSPAPVYDMSPMALAPRVDGTLPDRLPSVPPPPPEQKNLYEEARTFARRYFKRVTEAPRFQPEFRRIFEQ